MIMAGTTLPSVKEEAVDRDARITDEEGYPLSKRPRQGHKCEVCGTSYTEKRSLVRHFQSPAHCKSAGISVISYSCRYCGQHMSRNDLRQRHENEVHHGAKRLNAWSRTNIGTSYEAQINAVPSGPVSRMISPRVGSGALVPSLCSSTTSTSGKMAASSRDSMAEPSTSPDEQETFCANRDLDADLEDWKVFSDSIEKFGDNENAAVPDLSLPQYAHQEDTMSIKTNSTVGSIKKLCRLPDRLLRSTLIYKGASPRVQGTSVPVRCVQCQEYLGTSIAEIREHLNKHTPTDSESFCQICQIGFKKVDFMHHEASLARGHCGFAFDHIEPCCGHHPPDMFSEMLSDNDRLRFSSKVQHWNLAQLNTYLDQVKNLVSGDTIPTENDCWSIDALLSSLGSLPSMLGYQKPSSVPDTNDYRGRLTITLPRRTRGRVAAAFTRRYTRNEYHEISVA